VHNSVLTREAIRYLKCNKKSIVLDCTLGCGGHAKDILEIISPQGRLIGLDADRESIEFARCRLKGFEGSFDIVNENFLNFDSVLSRLGIPQVDAMLFDLGISSFQLDDNSRGFSFQNKATLDMRMDTTKGMPLWQALNSMKEQDIGSVIRDFGEERYWRRIAKVIASARMESPIKDSLQLAEIIKNAAHFSKRSRIHPATRTFQAFRIFVNDELDVLRKTLLKVPGFLCKGGRVVVISFHSLEDRIVKHAFKVFAAQSDLKILTKKPVRPEAEEIFENPRSRSAKLRAAERI
jgi:16S rRNA (cytosine1402-N4)-methyltransferase